MEKQFSKYGKTLRKLLSEISFDDIVPMMKADAYSAYHVAEYRQAYDILLQTSPSEDGCGDIEVSRTAEDGEHRLCAYEVEGCRWEDVIDGDIYLEEGPDVTDAAVAYAILWHLTFYGYDDRSKAEAYRHLTGSSYYDNSLGRMAFDTEVRRDWLMADAETQKDLTASVENNRKEGWLSYALTQEQWDAIEYRRRHCNGPKRKRDFRLERRAGRLKRMSICENTLTNLLAGQKCTEVTRKRLSFLSDAERRYGCEFQSHTGNAETRQQYIADLITKYDAVSFREPVRQIAVRLASSPAYPLTGYEIRSITGMIKKAAGLQKLVYIEAEDETLGPEIYVMVVGSIE